MQQIAKSFSNTQRMLVGLLITVASILLWLSLQPSNENLSNQDFTANPVTENAMPSEDTPPAIISPATVHLEQAFDTDAPLGLQATGTTLEHWLQDRGYDLLRDYAESSERLDTESRSPYLAYDQETLQALAQAGDPVAQAYYGLNISFDEPDEAASWLQEAIINGGYSAFAWSLSDLFLEQAAEWRENEESLHLSDDPNEERLQQVAELASRYQGQGYIWLLWGELRNDPQASLALTETDFLQLDASEQQQLREQAKALHKKLSHERVQRGLPLFKNDTAPHGSPAEAIGSFLE